MRERKSETERVRERKSERDKFILTVIVREVRDKYRERQREKERVTKREREQ